MTDEELVHRVVDGEATAEERRLLEEGLRLDPAARGRFEELQKLRKAIDAVPRLEPPRGLVGAVMAAVRARAGRGSRASTPLWTRLCETAGRRPALGLGLAFASGILLAALAGGLADLGPWPREGVASATMLPSEGLAGREIHRIVLTSGGRRAEAVAFAAVAQVVVRIVVEGHGRGDLVVAFPAEQASPLAFGRRSEGAGAVHLGPAGLRVEQAGAGRYELAFAEPPSIDSVEVRLADGDAVGTGVLRLGGEP